MLTSLGGLQTSDAASYRFDSEAAVRALRLHGLAQRRFQIGGSWQLYDYRVLNAAALNNFVFRPARLGGSRIDPLQPLSADNVVPPATALSPSFGAFPFLSSAATGTRPSQPVRPAAPFPPLSSPRSPATPVSSAAPVSSAPVPAPEGPGAAPAGTRAWIWRLLEGVTSLQQVLQQ
jgi:hypothetical protein